MLGVDCSRPGLEADSEEAVMVIQVRGVWLRVGDGIGSCQKQSGSGCILKTEPIGFADPLKS